MDKYDITQHTFDSSAERYQEKYFTLTHYQDSYDVLLDLVTQATADIFEIACGPGNIAHYLLNRRPDYRIDGIDVSPNMVALAQRNNPSAQFQVMDCRDIAGINKRYDAIICGFCIPYLEMPDVIALLRSIRSLLKPGGILYLSTIDGEYEQSGWQYSSSGDKVYTWYYPAEFLIMHLQQLGFRIHTLSRKLFPSARDKVIMDLFIYAQVV